MSYWWKCYIGFLVWLCITIIQKQLQLISFGKNGAKRSHETKVVLVKNYSYAWGRENVQRSKQGHVFFASGRLFTIASPRNSNKSEYFFSQRLNRCYNIDQWSLTTRPQSCTGLWTISYQAAQKK